MSTVRKIELKSAGQEAMLQVHSAGLATVGKYPEVEFVGLDEMNRPAMIAVNQKSADRQLTRIGHDYGSVAGSILKFSRSANPTDAAKPYWNIDDMGEMDLPVSNGNGHAKPAPAVTPAPRNTLPPDDAPHPADREPVKAEPTPKDLYLAITKDTLAHVVPLYVAAKIPIEMSAVAAIVATRFITATQRH